MPAAMMLLGFTRAVGRFVGDEGTIDLADALRVGAENKDHPDPDGALKAAYKETGPADWDLDDQLATIERYFALFEALNWAVSLDDRLSRDWPFEEIAFGKYWCDDFAGGGLIRGLRHARNAVHHDWSLALDIDPIESPFHLRLDLLGLAWSSERLSDRDDDSVAAYDANLGGRVVGDTLFEISELLAAGTKIVEGGVPEQGSGPARVKEFADDLYEPAR
jgi:hypothetical protein